MSGGLASLRSVASLSRDRLSSGSELRHAMLRLKPPALHLDEVLQRPSLMFAEFAFEVTGEDGMQLRRHGHDRPPHDVGLWAGWWNNGKASSHRIIQPRKTCAIRTAFTGANLSRRRHALQTLS